MGQPTPLQEIYPHASEDALDLLRQLLQFDPHKRITTEGALNHPYVAAFHNEEEEIVCEKVIRIAIDDDHKYSISEYRDVLYQQIQAKRKESKRKAKEKKARALAEGEDGEKKKRKSRTSKRREEVDEGEKKRRKRKSSSKRESKEEAEGDKKRKKRSSTTKKATE